MPQSPEHLIEELRAENVALKKLMIALREKKGTAAMIEFSIHGDRAEWIITAPYPVLERELGKSVGEAVAERLTEALALARITFKFLKYTGTSADEQPATEPEDT